MVAEYGLDHRRVGRGAAARQRLVHRSVRYGYRHRRRARATRRYALGRRTRPRTVVRNPSWWTGHRPTAASLDPPWNRRQASIAQPSAERTRLPLCLPGLARPGGMAGDRPLLATPGDLRPRRDGVQVQVGRRARDHRRRRGADLRVVSRNGLDVTAAYPQLAELVALARKPLSRSPEHFRATSPL
jgi:hypothetical protein